MVSPRKSRRKSACFSRTTTCTPARASKRPSIIPAGPPPTMQHRAWRSDDPSLPGAGAFDLSMARRLAEFFAGAAVSPPRAPRELAPAFRRSARLGLAIDAAREARYWLLRSNGGPTVPARTPVRVPVWHLLSRYVAAAPPETWHMNRDPLVRFDPIGAGVRIDVHVDVGEPRGLPGEAPPPSSATSSSLTQLERTLHSGHVVGGRYELVRLLGRGSMGAVWLANHTTLGERVALKLMTTSAEAGSVEDARTSAARFRFEAQIAARLSRKTRHVVRVTDHGHDGPLPYLVMELLEGQTLEKALLCRGPLSVGEVSALVSQIARGLEAAHAEGVLHRDLKPANVFLADSGEGRPVVKLLDFGVARRRRGQELAAPFATAKGLIVGTPGYMSPEQAAATEIDFRSDLWSLAAIAYEALTGELPVAGVDADHMLWNLRACRTVPLRERRPDLPASLDRFFEQAFAPRIEDRYGTCAELAHAFEQALRAGAGPGGTRRLPPPAVASADTPRPEASSGKTNYARYSVVAFLIAAGLTGLCYASARSPGSRSSARATSAPVADPVAVREPAGPSLGQTGRASSMQMQTTPPSVASPVPLQGSAAAPTPPAPKAARPWAPGELGEFKSYY